tara:strand:- start:414 stop:545 length:132 start_codon:yes stop_codon:yes gene_type:complete
LTTKSKVEIINLRNSPAILYGIDEEVENGFPKTMKNLKQNLKK